MWLWYWQLYFSSEKRLEAWWSETFKKWAAFSSKNISPERYNHFMEDNRNDIGDRIMHTLHYKCLKLIYLNNNFDIKDAATKYIPGTDIHNDSDMEYPSFTKANQKIMNQVVWECSRRLCEFFCLGNEKSLLNNVDGLLL